MTLLDSESVDLATPSGPMRTHLFRPTAPGKYPGILLYSEIFQVTGPIRRTAAFLAGHGFVVAVPEIYHEFEPAGTVLAYDQAGAERGNALKTTKELAAYDADARAVLAYLGKHPQCTGKLGVMGICIGGHLAFRAAMNPEWERNPVLQALDVVRMLLADLLFQGRPTGRSRTNRGTRKDEAAQQCTEGKTMTANFPGRSRLTHNLTPVG